MSDPVRLKDDPEFLRETGVSLEDALSTSNYDLGGLKSRLLQQVSSVPAAPVSVPGSGALSSAAFKSAAVVAAFVGGWAAHTIIQPPPVPVVIRVPSPMPVPVLSPAATVAPPVEVAVAPRVRPVITAPKEKQPLPVEKPVETPTPPPPASLAEQLRLFESGRVALKAGNHAIAVREFERYVDTIPSGDLWPEAAMGLLDALTRTGAFARVDTHASNLLKDTRMRSASPEILRARAWARANLGRCADAQADVDAMARGADQSRAQARVDGLCPR